MRHTQKFISLPYNSALKNRARALRKAGNLSEVLLWQEIKKKKLMGLDFDRQKIIGNYIVDFYCAEKCVVIEIDGSSHDQKIDYDAKRNAFLERYNLTIIHIKDMDVKKNLSGVLTFLKAHPAFIVESPEITSMEEDHPDPTGHPSTEGN